MEIKDYIERMDNTKCILIEFINDKTKNEVHPLGVAYAAWIVGDINITQCIESDDTTVVMKWPNNWPKKIQPIGKLRKFLESVEFEDHPVKILAQGSGYYHILICYSYVNLNISFKARGYRRDLFFYYNIQGNIIKVKKTTF